MPDIVRTGALLGRVARRRTQSHIRYVAQVPPGRATGLVARVYAQVEREFGLLAPPVSLHAPAPATLAAAWLMLRETLLVTGAVRRPVKEAVAVAVSHLNACPYCVDVHGTALHGLLRSPVAAALAGGAAATDDELRRVTDWAGGPPPREPAGGLEPAPGPERAHRRPHPAAHRPELVGTAVTFHYLNRMVNLFLTESPIPPGVPPPVRRAIRRAGGALMRPLLRRTVRPGQALDLLPPAPLPPDLGWAAGDPAIRDAFARAAAAVGDAGRRTVPAPVRELVTARLAGWDGRPPGASTAWVRPALAELAPEHRPAGRLALLAAMASSQAGPSVIEEFRRYRTDDRSLVEVAAWASMAAARHLGERLWRRPAAAGGSPP